MPKIKLNDNIIDSIAVKCDLPIIKKTNNLFVDLLESVVSQQLSSKVAATIYKRFCSLFQNGAPNPEDIILCSLNDLRSLGISSPKATYIKNIAEFALSNDISVEHIDSLSDEEIIDKLTAIKGVGVWTVQMILIFSLNRPDVFPKGDLAIQQGMKKLYTINAEGKDLLNMISSISDKWKPHRSIATRYL